MLTPRDRVLKTFRFEATDRAPFDLMEGILWPELFEYFREAHGLTTPEQVIDFLDPDFRWVYSQYAGPAQTPEDSLKVGYIGTYSERLFKRPLADAATVADVEKYPWPELDWWKAPDFRAARDRWPDYALTYLAGWQPLFCGACNAFGMETALMHMCAQPDLFEAFVRCQHERYMALLKRAMDQGMGLCDVVWLADDVASGDAMMMHPDLWRKLIKPYLAEQVRYLRDHGLMVLFHSCGNVRDILPDFIEIGINAHLVFQTSARNMDAPSIAREFGGKLAFYGGIDCQQLLTFGTPEQVKDTVRANVKTFEKCGGYFVANSHHCIANIQGQNILAMCEAARTNPVQTRRNA